MASHCEGTSHLLPACQLPRILFLQLPVQTSTIELSALTISFLEHSHVVWNANRLMATNVSVDSPPRSLPDSLSEV